MAREGKGRCEGWRNREVERISLFFLMDVDREDSQLGLRMTRGRRIKAGQRTQDRRSNQKGKYARGITVHKADTSN